MVDIVREPAAAAAAAAGEKGLDGGIVISKAVRHSVQVFHFLLDIYILDANHHFSLLSSLHMLR